MLTRLTKEITNLETLIDSAEREHDQASRIRFRYDWLRRDLELIRSGIESYLTDTHMQPRTVEQLQGLYHQ